MVARHLLMGLALAALLAGCTRSRDVQQDLELVDVRTGWYDAGILETGENKLVPMVTLKVQNVSQEEIANVQFNAIFRRIGEQEAWGDHFVLAIGSDGLAPGATTDDLVLRSPRGYTGTEPRLQMLKNSHFVDVRVEVFGKHGSRTWAKVGEFPIERQLITD